MRETAPLDVRRHNERRIVTLLLHGEAFSRAELAHRTGLSAPTVGKVVDDLIARGVLEEHKPERRPSNNGKRASLGRPSRPVTLERQSSRFLCVELGVRETAVAALPVAGLKADEVVETVRFTTPRRSSTWEKRLSTAVESLGPLDLWATVVSVPGVCDEQSGRVLLSPNLHWTETIDLPELIAKYVNTPVLLVQDIRALALGHLSERDSSADFILVDFGDGVGGALVRGGDLYQSPSVLSCEIGHNPVLGNERLCGCGAVGCVETLISKDGLLKDFTTSDDESDHWSEFVEHVTKEGLTPSLVHALDATAMVIAGAMNVTGVTEVVITGALTELPEEVLLRLKQSINHSSMSARFGEISVVSAPRRRTSGLVTAAIERLVLPVSGPPT